MKNVVVSRVMTKNFNGTNLYSFFVENVDGLFRHGQVPVKFDRGAVISFEYTETPKGINVNPKSVVVHNESTDVAKQGASAKKAPGAYSMGEKDAKISYMSARNAAINVAQIALEGGLLSLGTKKADQLDNLRAFIDELSMQYFLDLETLGDRADEQRALIKELKADDENVDVSQGEWEDD